jgi:hypothetical protein
MRKNHTDTSQKKKGRVLARVLSEELRHVQGGHHWPIFTDTQALPGEPGDQD